MMNIKHIRSYLMVCGLVVTLQPSHGIAQQNSGASATSAKEPLNAIDKKGNLLQSNFYGDSITKIDRKGQTKPFVTSGLSGPVGIAINEQTGDVYVANCRQTHPWQWPAWSCGWSGRKGAAVFPERNCL
jgi:DNA-binding beta-propeller fold protein YncE